MRIIQNSEVFRKNIRDRICTKLVGGNEKWAHNLEVGIYNFTLQEANKRNTVKQWEDPYFVNLYIEKLRMIFQNMSPELLNKLENKEIKSFEIAFMTHQQLRPKKWESLLNAKMKRDASKYEVFTEAMTDMFLCNVCKSRRTTYRTAQIRSADEPETIFVTCLDCGKRWRSS